LINNTRQSQWEDTTGASLYSSRCKDKPKKEAGDQSAQMGCHADLWSREIEHSLNRDDHRDVYQALFRVGRVPVSNQKSRPCADDSHDASGRTNELSHLYETDYR
jgi:hypothetical protein